MSLQKIADRTRLAAAALPIFPFNIPRSGDGVFLLRVEKLRFREAKMIGSLFGESNDPGSHRHSSLLKSKPKLDGLRLLVIDDSFLIRQALAFLLKSWGCELTLASNARIACDQFQRDKAPHIIISNFRLNDDCDGINAIRLVRKLAGRKIPAFLMGKTG